MIKSFKAAIAALTGVFALGTCAGCATSPYLPGSKSVDAVQEICLTDRHLEETALCLIGAYAASVEALAAEREAGTLDPAVVKAADAAIDATAERVAVAADLWGAVSGWREEVETLKPLADKCIETISDQSKLSECLGAVGYLTATGQLQRASAQAQSDWATLKPKVEAVIGLRRAAVSG